MMQNKYTTIIIDNKTIKIDNEDLHLLDKYTWRINAQGYLANRNINMRFHNFIMNRLDCSDGKVTDHINQDKLDNRKSNLRLVSKQINAFNSKVRTDNTSGYTGVCWDKGKDMWMSRIHINGHGKFLGYYNTPERAYEVRLKKETEVLTQLLEEAK